MSISIRKGDAVALIQRAASEADRDEFDGDWFTKVEQLSKLCEAGASKTHIAFLGTSMIAKAARLDVDLFAIKPRHARNNPKAYSARTLCHSVLVPLAAQLGISIGVTGREPLNNQPYFRMTRLGDNTPVHSKGRAAFYKIIELLNELGHVSTTDKARAALAAFIAERRRYQPRYTDPEGELLLTPSALPTAIATLVQNDSESGRRAQAVVAGLMDAFAGPARVESGRINDPSRRYPGDVCIRSIDDSDTWEKAIEVRDKPVTLADVQIFGAKCLSMGVRETAVVAVAHRQVPLDDTRLSEWAAERGLGITLFMSWKTIVDQVLFWSSSTKLITTRRAAEFIKKRLITVEASPESVELWVQLCDRAKMQL